MKISELVENISKKTQYDKSQVDLILRSALDEIADSLKKGEEVKLFGFGKFVAREYKERKCYNPITKDIIKLSPSIQPAFMAGPKLRQYINNK